MSEEPMEYVVNLPQQVDRKTLQLRIAQYLRGFCADVDGLIAVDRKTLRDASVALAEAERQLATHSCAHCRIGESP